MVSRDKQLYLLAVIATSGILFAMILPYPLCSDESIFQWMSLQLVGHGALPYVGTWDHNFPGILLFHCCSILLFGNSALGFRITEVLFQVATAVILYRLLLRWFTRRAAYLATFFYALGATSWGMSYVGQRDVLGAGLFLWGLAAWAARRNDTRWILLSGLIFGVCVLIRPTFAPPALTLLLVNWKEPRVGQRAGFLFALSFPMLASIVPYLLTGTIGNYYDATILFNLSMYQTAHSPLRELFIRLKDATKLDGLAIFALLPAKILPPLSETTLVRRPSPRERLTYLAVLVEFFLLYVVQRKYILVYSFAPVLALLAPLAALGLERLLGVFDRKSIRAVLRVSILVFIFIAFSIVRPIIRSLTTHDLSPLIPFADDPEIGFSSEDNIIQYLEQPRNAHGAIEIVTFNARLRARLDRSETSPFPMAQALALHDANGRQPKFQQGWNREFISNITRTPARFVLIGNHWGYWQLPPLGPNLSRELPRLDSVLRANYERDTTIGAYTIYRIRNEDPEASVAPGRNAGHGNYPPAIPIGVRTPLEPHD